MANTNATIETNHGTIELELFSDDAPKTVANFTKLAGEGFYDGLVFHRVIPDFMIQAVARRASAPAAPATSSTTRSTTTRSCGAHWPWPTQGRTRTAASSSS